jgi:hypothetical protein
MKKIINLFIGILFFTCNVYSQDDCNCETLKQKYATIPGIKEAKFLSIVKRWANVATNAHFVLYGVHFSKTECENALKNVPKDKTYYGIAPGQKTVTFKSEYRCIQCKTSNNAPVTESSNSKSSTSENVGRSTTNGNVESSTGEKAGEAIVLGFRGAINSRYESNAEKYHHPTTANVEATVKKISAKGVRIKIVEEKTIDKEKPVIIELE